MSLEFKYTYDSGRHKCAMVRIEFLVDREKLIEGAIIAAEKGYPMTKAGVEKGVRNRFDMYGHTPDVCTDNTTEQWDAAEEVVLRLWPEVG